MATKMLCMPDTILFRYIRLFQEKIYHCPIVHQIWYLHY